MVNVRGRVKNGRLIVDEPTDLPDGTEVHLTGDQVVYHEEVLRRIRGAPPAEERLTEEEVAELAAIRERGEYVPHEEVRRKLLAKRQAEQQDPPKKA